MTHAFATREFGSVPKQGNCCDHWYRLECMLAPRPTPRVQAGSAQVPTHTHRRRCRFTGVSGCEFADSPILASCNLGFVAMFDLDCQLRERWKLHKDKVSSLDLHPRDTNLFATTSVDRTCRIWDRRMMRARGAGGKESVCEALLSITGFGGAVSSAVFSSTGQRLLVTAQDNSVRVCQLAAGAEGVSLVRGCQPGWGDEYLAVKHPHRFYQHLTQHRASFHPRSDDLFVIGRFPDKDAAGAEAERGLDVYSCSSGQWVARLGLNWPGIQAGAAAIRRDGEAVASMSGHTVLVYTCAHAGSVVKGPGSSEPSDTAGSWSGSAGRGTKGPEGSGKSAAKKKRARESAADKAEKAVMGGSGRKKKQTEAGYAAESSSWTAGTDGDCLDKELGDLRYAPDSRAQTSATASLNTSSGVGQTAESGQESKMSVGGRGAGAGAGAWKKKPRGR